MKHHDVTAVDFDDPRYAFRTPLSEIERQKIFSTNARAVYKF